MVVFENCDCVYCEVVFGLMCYEVDVGVVGLELYFGGVGCGVLVFEDG